jgi:hypothetical protein
MSELNLEMITGQHFEQRYFVVTSTGDITDTEALTKHYSTSYRGCQDTEFARLNMLRAKLAYVTQLFIDKCCEQSGIDKDQFHLSDCTLSFQLWVLMEDWPEGEAFGSWFEELMKEYDIEVTD